MFERSLHMQVVELCKRGLDVGVLRQQAIADNIANIDTPLFKRKVVEFESYLQAALARNIPLPSIIKNINPRIVVEADTFLRADKNNVDINEEIAALTKNQLIHQAITERVNNMFKVLNNVIKTRL